ncbi:MAG TPA: prepilin-type N-terminal cleavage/methylation domain-containing protein [Candidatus Acidoferrum sp.]|jgi:prepilin-type N-terminal cleavage/methylation domain-containing protein|nr:prepilin-type N-terminal cleavage/methylation domain-containing protein [Candidatus Acidoferrum sp.]
MNTAGKTGKRAAFTLIELLVVIAIIAILAAILLPVLSSAKLRAQEVADLSNLKQLATSSSIYYDENNTWVGPMNTNNPSLSQGDWMGAMLTYYGHQTNVLYCPMAPPRANPSGTVNPPGKADAAWIWSLSSPPYASSYGINKWLAATAGLGNSVAHPNYLYTTEATVRYPSSVPVFTDAAWINFDPLETDSPARNLYDPLNSASQGGGAAVNEGMPRICISRHGSLPPGAAPKSVTAGTPLPGDINMNFVDCHVEEVLLNNVWNYNWHLGWQIPSPRPP